MVLEKGEEFVHTNNLIPLYMAKQVILPCPISWMSPSKRRKITFLKIW